MTESSAPLPRGPRFDPTVNLGHIITFASVIISMVGLAFLGDFRLSAVEKEVAKVGSIVIEWARLSERMSDYGRRLERLEARAERSRAE